MSLSPEDVAAARSLTNGLASNFAVVSGIYDGQSVALVVEVLDVEDHYPHEHPNHVAFGLAPVAILCDERIAERMRIEGLDQDPGSLEGAADRATMDEAPEIIPLSPYDLCDQCGDHSPEDLEGLEDLEEVADFAASVGGLAVHSTDDGRWCAHVGPVDDAGCVRDHFIESITHAVTQHAPSPGDPLLGPDDPRASSHLN